MNSALRRLSNKSIFHVKCILFLACLWPLLCLLTDALIHDLGPDPVQTLTHFTGQWTLRFLLFGLFLTPLRYLTGWLWVIRLRRMVGLYCFFYACLHFSVYLVFDQFFDWSSILKDVSRHPYITVGFFSFVLLIPLALTSTDNMIRRIGGYRWRSLHKLIYLIATASVFHYLLLVKRDITEPAIYIIVLIILLCVRLIIKRKEHFKDIPLSHPNRTPTHP